MCTVSEVRAAAAHPPLKAAAPGGVGLSNVRVYSSASLDGQCGGTPHVHLACSEMYVVLSGHGHAEFLTGNGFQAVALYPGATVSFSPGTLHRLITAAPSAVPGAAPAEPGPGSPAGGLEVLVVMENGHLNESGDAVLTFAARYLADPEQYARLAAGGPPAALRARRDLAVQGFTDLARIWRTDPQAGLEALRTFHQRAVALVAGSAAPWEALVIQGPLTAARNLATRAAAIAAADPGHLSQATVATAHPPSGPAEASEVGLSRQGGMCGWVHRYAEHLTAST
jgi:mannose-6-phosphate isomerase-like protein (cupin superfamily)